MTGHLGDLAAGLVDGQLAPGVRDRALRHVAQCARCRDEVAEQEHLKSELSHLFAPPPPSDLASRLLQLPASPVVTDGSFLGGGEGRSQRAFGAPFRPIGRTDRVNRPLSYPAHGHRVRRVVLASASVLVLGAGGAFAAGGGTSASGGPQVTPPTTAYFTQHVSTTNVAPLSDPALNAVSFRQTP
jgi:anti-sigma factor RsiW